MESIFLPNSLHERWQLSPKKILQVWIMSNQIPLLVLWVVKNNLTLTEKTERVTVRHRDNLQQPEDRNQACTMDTWRIWQLWSWDLRELLQTAIQYSSEPKLFLLPPHPPNKKGTQRPFLGAKYHRSSISWQGPDSARAQHTAVMCPHGQTQTTD